MIELEPDSQELEDGFVYFDSGHIPYGNNSIEISVINTMSENYPNYESTAIVQIKKLTFFGT